MPIDWTRAEVEATVADYFDMLEQELRGAEYNKTAHRRRLAALLRSRSDGAIERKHQNISAILIELGFAYISGYKPLGNYQQLLFEIVSDRLAENRTLIATVQAQIAQPAQVPSVDDILAAMVAPPAPSPHGFRYGAEATHERPNVRPAVNYLALEASNRSLGAAGEEFVARYEIARLIAAGRERLASSVERVSNTRGDGLGYDILSFETTGEERLVEVKTTAYGPSTPFFVSRNEVAVSQLEAGRFQLYRAFNFRRAPRIFARQGPIDQ
ncbi:MAG TPA: DUF3883 domain-containing protein, partial [Gemmatimonadaceae bacterium]